jgi:hypothetical protein
MFYLAYPQFNSYPCTSTSCNDNLTTRHLKGYTVFKLGMQQHPGPPKLLDHVRAVVRLRHFALSTEKAYVHWIRAFVKHRGLRHPKVMGAAQVESLEPNSCRGFL